MKVRDTEIFFPETSDQGIGELLEQSESSDYGVFELLAHDLKTTAYEQQYASSIFINKLARKGPRNLHYCVKNVK